MASEAAQRNPPEGFMASDMPSRATLKSPLTWNSLSARGCPAAYGRSQRRIAATVTVP